MKRDTRKTLKINSSFLSCEKDLSSILKRLFIESEPYGEKLERLLVINTKDCLDNQDSEVIKQKLEEINLHTLIDKGYVKIAPKIRMPEHEEIKSYIIISFDNFTPNMTNPYYRDCTVNFDIICHTDYWDIGDYRVRPLTIAGYIDGILNECHLSGIGTFNFIGCNELVLNEDLSGYTLSYRAIHGNDDYLEPVEE